MSDTGLRSSAVALALLAISEGEIYGPVGGTKELEKSVTLNGVPIMAADGTRNFEGTQTAWVPGTRLQDYIHGFPTAASEIGTGYPVEVKKTQSHTFQVEDPNIDAVKIRWFVEALQEQKDNGDLVGASVQVCVEVKDSSPGADWVLLSDQTISDRAASRYEWPTRINLADAGPVAPWTVRCTRVTDDSTNIRLQNKTWIASRTTIVDHKLRYPNTSILAVRVDAAPFSGGVPTIGAKWRGRLVKIPTNYDPETRTYSGEWDGQFKVGWTNNPAWVLYDLCIEPRFGLGRWVQPWMVDRYYLYSVARYCDEKVPSGFKDALGADILEPRFTCNLYLQKAEEAYRVLANVASIARCMTYFAGGAVFTVQDRPSDPAAQFNRTNVLDGMFHYTSTARRARPNVCLVTWNNPENGYKQEIEYVEDAEAIQKAGYVFETRIVAIGCTSRGQAHRQGLAELLTSKLQPEAVSFETGLAGVRIRPGDVFATQDPGRVPEISGGRLRHGSGRGILLLDRPVPVSDVAGCTVSLTLPDGRMQERRCISFVGSTLQCEPFEAPPPGGAVWVLQTPDAVPEFWRAVSITEKTRTTYAISGIKYDPAKYDLIDYGVRLESKPAGGITTAAPSVVGLSLSEGLYIAGTGIKVRLAATWSQATGASAYVVEVRRDGGPWVSAGETATTRFEWPDVTPGIYDIRVAAKSARGHAGVPAAASLQVLGKLAPPADVTGLTAEVGQTSITLSWQPIPDVDWDHYEVRQGTDWGSAMLTAPKVCATNLVLPRPASAQTITYWIKAWDTSGNPSTQAASVTASIAAVSNVLYAAQKRRWVTEKASIDGEYSIWLTRASGAGVSSGAYQTAKSALDTYLTSLLPAWNDETKDTPINATTWDGKWNGYYNARANLQAAIDVAVNSAIANARQSALAALASAPKIVTGLPALPNASYPADQLVWDTASRAMYRSLGSGTPTYPNGWEPLKITPEMIIGTLTAGIISAGAVGAEAMAAILMLATQIRVGYQETNGVPTAGVKLDGRASQKPMMAGPGGIQIGAYSIGEFAARSLTCLESKPYTEDASYRAFYRGMCNPSVRGGAPNIACLSVSVVDFAPADDYFTYQLRIKPASGPDDNLDGMRHVRVKVFLQNGTQYGPTRYVPIGDRLYNDMTTDSSTANSNFTEFSLNFDTNMAPYPYNSDPYVYLLCALVNAYGVSEEWWFGPNGSGNGVPFTAYGTASPIGGPSGGGAAGGGGGFGGCVPASAMVSMADGRLVPIEILPEGATVRAYDEHTWEPCVATVTRVHRFEDRALVTVRTHAGTLLCSEDHRLSRNALFVRAGDLVPGDAVYWEIDDQLSITEVTGIESAGRDTVYHLSLDRGHVWIADAVPAHNKQLLLPPS